MNRAQRRAEVKNLQKKGVKRDTARTLVNTYYNDSELEEGQAVKLNYEMMIRHPDWKQQRDDFKAWVTEHKEKVFHVEWDVKKKESNSFDKKKWVCLKEDETDPKWLFRAETLTSIAEATIKLDNGDNIKVPLDGVTDQNDPIIQEKISEALDLKE